MLRSLHIQNYALIEELDITFEPGFSVITGETGAGKSIILGAIGLLLGQRADTKTIKYGASKCVIEARFDVSGHLLKEFFEANELEYDEECIMRREVHASGKSRAFINDTPASLAQMKELSEQLIDVHSQHQNLLLNKEDFQLNVLDMVANNEELLSRYKTAFQQWRGFEKELNELVVLAEKGRADQEFLQFQLDQLEQAQLKEYEQQELEKEVETLSHAEEIKSGLFRVEQILNSDEGGLLAALKEAIQWLNGVHKVYASAEELVERTQSSYIELKDIAQEVSSLMETVEFNPERLEQANERLNLIYSLQHKHHQDSVQGLIELADSYREKLALITSFDEQIEQLQKKAKQQFAEVKKLAEALTTQRRKAAKEVDAQMVERLIPLGMPNIRFQVNMGTRKEPAPSGQDTVAFLFSANKSGELQSLSVVASGGEIARVMLSIKAMVAGKVKLPTIIFDEIDIGVSGEIADRMADIMYQMGAQNRQVISITHLPQIAARGSAHYFVYKKDTDTDTNSHIRRLTEEERVAELAQMLSGSTITEAALSNARELLKKSK